MVEVKMSNAAYANITALALYSNMYQAAMYTNRMDNIIQIVQLM